jgi:hypothetical protein
MRNTNNQSLARSASTAFVANVAAIAGIFAGLALVDTVRKVKNRKK